MMALPQLLSRLHARLQAPVRAPMQLPGLAPTAGAVLAGLCGAAFGAVVWAAIAPIGPIGRLQSPLAARAQEPAQSLGALSRFDPFFRSAPAEQGADAARLGLSLHSVRQDRRGGSAIIGRNGAEQRSYAVGDQVAPGVQLLAVGVDHVVLQQAGGRLKLSFPESGTGPARMESLGGGAEATAAAPADGPPSGLVAGAPAAIDPLALLKQAQFQPRLVDGKVTGFRVASGSGAMFAKSGLQPGDVVVRLGNTPIDRFEMIEDLQTDLGQQRQIPVTVERGGAVITLLWTQAEG
ncbi:MAG: hypothetical protein K2P95_00220 [Hyphomonadaceae bacterium]|nr:hypothetical protein [Hyphomonadaceae bacterium]